MALERRRDRCQHDEIIVAKANRVTRYPGDRYASLWEREEVCPKRSWSGENERYDSPVAAKCEASWSPRFPK
jgi:hypothetical protein